MQIVHKKFYASGFLYHPGTTQILLQQQNSSDKQSLWSLIGSVGQGSETRGENFKRLARTLLNLNLSFEAIHGVYDYFHTGLGKKHYVFYAEVGELENFPPTQKTVFAWFTQKEISKLNISIQTKQDIIVGQRVIDSTVRKNSGERTIG